MTEDRESRATPAWRIDRSGEFGSYAVRGWRYTDLAIWHVNIWLKSEERPELTYVVAAGEFYPETVTTEEKFGVLHLIAGWEANPTQKPSTETDLSKAIKTARNIRRVES